jgi:hypothetical protein
MFAELALRLFTAAPADIRRLGLVADAVALWSRASRRRADWAPHEARCHAIVERALADLTRRDTVAVLGSGLCRDVPIDILADRFARVVLVDAVHLWPVRRRLRRFANVEFVACDITGTAAWITGMADARSDALARFRDDPRVDLVISANLLSQIAVGPEDWLDDHPQRARALPPDLPQQLIPWHLDDLARFPCPVCLLTDVEMRRIDRAGAVIEQMDLVEGAELGPPDDAWDWLVAPYGEIGRNVARVHRVHGFARWGGGWRQRLPATGQLCQQKPCAAQTPTS